MPQHPGVKLQCIVQARFHSQSHNTWRIAQDHDGPEHVQERSVRLEIQGSVKHGYNLVISPDGLFTADYHYPTKADATESAHEIFGAEPTDWVEVDDS